MTWDEPPTDAIGSSVLNDLDLWLDEGADCGGTTCGEHSSTSRVDNVEWIVVRHPKPGVYRAKVAANRVYTDAPRVALAWTVVRGASMPNLRITTDRPSLKGAGTVKLRVTTDAYVAAGARLHVDCRSAGDIRACESVSIESDDARAGREDGLTRSLKGSGYRFDLSIPLGEVAAGETQTIELPLRFSGSDAVRVIFTVDAWNAAAASVAIDLLPEQHAGDSSGPPEAESAANDDFANAATIAGSTGSATLDLLLATTEPGEPAFDRYAWEQQRPFGSVWFEWAAPAAGAYRFTLVADHPDGLDLGDVHMGFYSGSQLAGLKGIGSAPWGGVLFADKGATYRLRVSHRGLTVPLTLQWTDGPKPANDDFADAIKLSGEDGSVSSTNLGATLEPGEAFDSLAATVWFDWRAPHDGAFRFQESTGRLPILVFRGARFGDLRLVSGMPTSSVTFPAERGALYRVAVATSSAYAGGRAFELSWRAEEDREAGNDDFEGAQDMGNEAQLSHLVALDEDSTVQPNEPAETGTRTTWYKWTAPSDGRYTWRLGETLFTELQLAMFKGTDLSGLQLVGRTGPDIVATEFSVDVTVGETYYFSVGFAASDSASMLWWSAEATLFWGSTPANDARAGATPLTGASGTESGTNEFATAGPRERGGKLGHSSLWWTFEPPASGWYRFSVAEEGFGLAVYRHTTEGRAPQDPIRSSAHSGTTDHADVLFHAKAGERYQIRLGRRVTTPEASSP